MTAKQWQWKTSESKLPVACCCWTNVSISTVCWSFKQYCHISGCNIASVHQFHRTPVWKNSSMCINRSWKATHYLLLCHSWFFTFLFLQKHWLAVATTYIILFRGNAYWAKEAPHLSSGHAKCRSDRQQNANATVARGKKSWSSWRPKLLQLCAVNLWSCCLWNDCLKDIEQVCDHSQSKQLGSSTIRQSVYYQFANSLLVFTYNLFVTQTDCNKLTMCQHF